MKVSANANDVLSAIGTISVPRGQGIAAVNVLISDSSGNDAGFTPAVKVGGATSIQVPILGLRPTALYVFTAQGLDSVVGGFPFDTSNPVPFATAALPAGVPSFSVADGGREGSTFNLVDNLPADPSSGVDYATVVDGTGQPVWYVALPEGEGRVGDMQKQPNDHYTVAVLDSASQVPVGPAGVFQEYDVLSNPVRTWRSPDALATNPHEVRILPDGTAVLFGVVSEQVDLSSVFDGGSADAGVYGDVLERLAADGGVIWTWSELANLSLADIDPAVDVSGPAVDATHSSSIDLVDGGDYVVGIRNMSEAVRLHPISDGGAVVVWTLGGPRSSFAFVGDPEGGFRFPNDVRQLPNGHILLFDDGVGRAPQDSRAVEYQLNTDAGTATLVWQSAAQTLDTTDDYGSAQRLTNGDTLVCYGTAEEVQETTPDGGIAFDLKDSLTSSPTDGGITARDQALYRAYRLPTLY